MSKSSIILTLFAVAVLTFSETSPLRAAPPDGFAASAKAVLQAKLLEPLQKKEAERSRFSRAALPPQARRIRILGDAARTDAQGRSFLPFALDESRGYGVNGGQEIAEAGWLKDVITGCVYPETGAVMVQRGKAYYASSVLLGLQTPQASDDVCRTK